MLLALSCNPRKISSLPIHIPNISLYFDQLLRQKRKTNLQYSKYRRERKTTMTDTERITVDNSSSQFPPNVQKDYGSLKDGQVLLPQGY